MRRSASWSRRWASDVVGRAVAAALLAVLAGLVVGGVAAAQSQAPEMGPPPAEGEVVTHDIAGMEHVTRHVMCTCGCNLTVATCEGAMTCAVSQQMKDDIADRLTSGMTPKMVLAAFAEDYGEQVLAAPTKRGFNLVAWVLPFVALGFGALLVLVAVLRWRGSERVVPAPTPEVDPADAALIDAEVIRRM